MGAYKAIKKFKLSDGTIIDPRQLAEKIGCSVSAARSRLKVSKDPERVFRPIHKLPENEIGSNTLVRLSNGVEMTPKELFLEGDVALETILARLRKGIRDPEELGKRKKKRRDHGKKWRMTHELSKDLENRNCFNELSRLLLKTI